MWFDRNMCLIRSNFTIYSVLQSTTTPHSHCVEVLARINEHWHKYLLTKLYRASLDLYITLMLLCAIWIPTHILCVSPYNSPAALFRYDIRELHTHTHPKLKHSHTHARAQLSCCWHTGAHTVKLAHTHIDRIVFSTTANAVTKHITSKKSLS